MSLVWVQFDQFTGLAARIFKTHMAAVSSGASIKSMDRGLAVSQIRRQVFSRQEGICLRCPNIITWTTGQLHETIPRGQGGEISIFNSEMLCSDCHLNKAHGDRKPQFSRTDWEPNTR